MSRMTTLNAKVIVEDLLCWAMAFSMEQVISPQNSNVTLMKLRDGTRTFLNYYCGKIRERR